MTGLIMAGQLILSLSILVTLHELGHFLAARAFGIKVEKFYIFFDAWGKKLFSFKKGETEYGIGWLPLGGYVKIAGMIDESMDKEAMKQPPKDYEFRSKPAWQRLIVMLAGVVVNFVVGIIIFAFITLHYEKQYLPANELDNGIYSYELANELGLQTGDKIIAVNGKDLVRFKDVLSPSNLMGGELTIDRNGKLFTVIVPDTFYRNFTQERAPLFIGADNFEFIVDSVVPNSNADKANLKSGDKIISINDYQINTFGDLKASLHSYKDTTAEFTILRRLDTVFLNVDIASDGTIGFFNKGQNYQMKNYTLGESLKYGLSDGVGVLAANIKGLGKIFTGQEKAQDSLQGPIGIATIFGGQWQWARFWYLTGLISLILAFMNILPIPALDGGHAMFLSFEIITGRQLPDKFMEYAQVAGMIILMALMVFVIGNDIWKHIIN
jgi:regulator of sigma E protease